MIYHNINPVLLKLGFLEIRYYGLIYILGFVITYYLLRLMVRERKLNLTNDDVMDYAFYAMMGVLIGGRVFYFIFYNLGILFQEPLELFKVWHGGMSFHGGLIGVFAATYIYSRKKKLSFYTLSDIIVIPTALALAFGRIGNYINGELYGRITNSSFCINYTKSEYLLKNNIIVEGCRWPSQFFQSAQDFLIFVSLFLLRNKKFRPGFITWLFFILMSAGRFFIEFFREPDSQLGFVLGPLTMGQVLSIPVFLTGIYMISGGVSMPCCGGKKKRSKIYIRTEISSYNETFF